ncbi:MAG: glutamine amidotransferase, partial [Anaerolineae bacterium]
RDASTIPQIFAQEAALALKAYLIEEEFAPRLTAASPILQGITALPNLLGYVATEPKLTAQTVLVSHNDDPVLAQWQYGLGRAVAFTSDATGRWGKLWVGWDGFARFWGQAVRWTIVEGATGNLETRVTFDPTLGATRLTVEALDSRGNFINNLNLQGSLVSPGLEQEPVSLEQVAPGLYQTDIHPDETGAYLLRVVGAGEGEQIAGSATRGFVVSYSPEYAAQPADPALMAGLAELGGGQTLSLNNPAAVFAHTLPPVGASSPLWPLLLAAFVLILPFDVGLRRVIIGREEVLKLAARLRRALPHRAAGAPASPAAPSSARSLLSIKEPRPQTPPSSRASRPISGQPPPVTPPPDLSPAPPPEPEPHPPAEDRMSRLLNAKRQAKK